MDPPCVGTALDMGLAQAVERAPGPSLQFREDALHLMQQLVRLAALDDTDIVGIGGQVFGAEPAIGDRYGRRVLPTGR